ncbi:MAG: hypothetical protein CBB71_20560 [Rhodopirellula sp. TMED11]|nr:MAG: hypothetical protein CBB71_20560 [Rhodopirellula sp. TMED11]
MAPKYTKLQPSDVGNVRARTNAQKFTSGAVHARTSQLHSPACGRVERQRGEGEVVGNANCQQPQRNPPRRAIETINAPALPIVPFIIAPPAANRPTLVCC